MLSNNDSYTGLSIITMLMAPAMETDIIIGGFRQPERTHRVHYMYVVGDGDSSVLSSNLLTTH